MEQYNVTGMSCAACSARVEKAVSKVPGVASYADVTPQLVQNTLEAQKKHNIAVAVLGTYVELAIADEVQRSANAADFKSQLAVCKALNAGCIGTETTGMHKQPAGTTRERAQYMLCKSLETILPEAERLGVTVAIEPVVGDSTNTLPVKSCSPELGSQCSAPNRCSFASSAR